MLLEITKRILSFKGNFEYDIPNSLLSLLGTVLSPAHALHLRIPALDTCRKWICQNKAVSVNAKWAVYGVIVLICHELFSFEREPTPGSVHKECIRLRGRGGWERSWHMCQKRSQPDVSDLSVSVQGPEGARASRALPRDFHTAQSLGGWATALTPEPLGEAEAAATGRRLLFLRFSN